MTHSGTAPQLGADNEARRRGSSPARRRWPRWRLRFPIWN